MSQLAWEQLGFSFRQAARGFRGEGSLVSSAQTAAQEPELT